MRTQVLRTLLFWLFCLPAFGQLPTVPVIVTNPTPVSVTVQNPVTVTSPVPLSVTVSNPVTISGPVGVSLTSPNPLTVVQSSPIPSDLNSMINSEGRTGSAMTKGVITQTVAASAITQNPDGTTTYTLTGAGINGTSLQAGDNLLPAGVTVSSMDKIDGYLYVGTNVNDTQMPAQLGFGNYEFITGAGGAPWTIATSGPINHKAAALSGAIVKVTKPYSTTSLTVTTDYKVVAAGSIYTGTTNHAAPYVIDIWGTSIPRGVGPTSDFYSIEMGIYNHWFNRGYNVRTRNRAVSGATTANLVYMAGQGDFDKGRKPAIIYIDGQTNDAISNVNSTTSVANMQTLVTRALNQTPVTLVVVIPPMPNGNTTTESRCVALRAALKTAIQAHPLYGNRVFLAEGVGTSFNPTDVTFYNNSDGQLTHPSNLGTAAYLVPVTITSAAIPALPLIPYK